MFDNRIGMVKTLPALPGDSGKSVSGCRLRKDGQLAASISLVEALGRRAFLNDRAARWRPSRQLLLARGSATAPASIRPAVGLASPDRRRPQDASIGGRGLDRASSPRPSG